MFIVAPLRRAANPHLSMQGCQTFFMEGGEELRVGMPYKISLNRYALKFSFKAAFHILFILNLHMIYKKAFFPLKFCFFPLSFRLLNR